jgi:hypothetical protein
MKQNRTKAIPSPADDPLFGRMNDPTSAAFIRGLCGDEMEFYLAIEGNIIKDVRCYTEGCEATRRCGIAEVRVQKFTDVARGHQVAHQVERTVRGESPNIEMLTVHLEPFQPAQQTLMVPAEERGLHARAASELDLRTAIRMGSMTFFSAGMGTASTFLRPDSMMAQRQVIAAWAFPCTKGFRTPVLLPVRIVMLGFTVSSIPLFCTMARATFPMHVDG